MDERETSWNHSFVTRSKVSSASKRSSRSSSSSAAALRARAEAEAAKAKVEFAEKEMEMKMAKAHLDAEKACLDARLGVLDARRSAAVALATQLLTHTHLEKRMGRMLGGMCSRGRGMMKRWPLLLKMPFFSTSWRRVCTRTKREIGSLLSPSDHKDVVCPTTKRRHCSVSDHSNTLSGEILK